MSLSRLVLPHELWDVILDHLHLDRPVLRTAALVCRTWVPTTRFHLFADIVLSPKCVARAAGLNALLMSPHATLAPAVRRLALHGALVPVQLRNPGGAQHLTTLIRLVPVLARLPRVKELELSDLPLVLLDGLKTVERLTLTGICAGAGLLRVVQAFPKLAQLTLEEVTAVPYRGGISDMKTGVHTLTIRGSSWQYLCLLGATLQELELAFFDTDPLDALALPRLLTPNTTLKTLRLHFVSAHEVRRFFAFGCQGPWPPAMRLEIAVENLGDGLDELFGDWSIDVQVVLCS
ncbi:hypothetical protein B0H14DRAFT_2691129, partial [Mycena olivaceomarginata]